MTSTRQAFSPPMFAKIFVDNKQQFFSKHRTSVPLKEAVHVQRKFSKEKLRTWEAHLKADIDDLLSTPFHLSKLRGWLGFANAYRIAFTFSRLTDQAFFLIVDKWSYFLRNNLYLPFNLDEMNRNINGPTATFRALSVGLFVARFLVNLCLVIQHTLFPTADEVNIPASARFYQAIKEHYPQLLNDLVWTITNALTNYAAFFKISSHTASGLLIAGLTFDFALLTYRLWDAEKEHKTKCLQYTREKQTIQQQLKQLLKNQKIDKNHLTALQQQLACIEAKMEEQQLKMRVLQANFYANLLAATLIVSSCTLSFLVASPAAIAACYLLIVVGTALYISADQYSEYKEKTFRQERLELKGDRKQLNQAKQDTALAWKNFVTAMLKNTFIPLLIMGTLAFSWHAALVLLVLFIAHEYATKYKKTDTAYKAQHLFAKPGHSPLKDNAFVEEQRPAAAALTS